MNSTTLKQWAASIIRRIEALLLVILVLGVMFLQSEGVLASENSESIITNLSTVTWSPYPGVPEGAELAMLRGNSAIEPSEALARLPAGYLFPHHYHTSRELLLFIEGDFTYIADDGTTQTLEDKAYLNLPGGTKHSVLCGDEPCLLYAQYDGPYDLILSPPPSSDK